jgi:transcriptional regulator with XRE-family HTH domain
MEQSGGRMAADGNTEAAVRFGQMLTRLRTAQRLSQNQLAQRAGLNHSYISRLESGGRGDPSRTVVEQFVGALGLDPAGREADELRMAAGFLPVDPAHLLTGETALAKLAALLEDPQLPDASRATLRRILGLLVEEYTRIAGTPDS